MGNYLSFTKVLALIFLILFMGQLHIIAQTAGFPRQVEANSKQLKKVRKQAADIYVDAKRNKEIPQAELADLDALYTEVVSKVPADIPSAALLLSEVYAAIGDRDAQMKYLHVVDSLYEQAPQPVKLWSSVDLGWNHYRGFGTPQDEYKALEYFMRAYEADSIAGAFPMAMASLYGMGSMPVDLALTAHLLQKSQHNMRWPLMFAIQYYLEHAAQNSAVQQGWENYLDGNRLFSIHAEPDNAIPYFQRAIDVKFLPACQFLADLYLEKGDKERALQIVEPAVSAEYSPAIHQKAYYIYSGTIGKMGQWKPIGEAYKLFKSAADAGYPPSQIATGQLTFNGMLTTVPKDHGLSYIYFKAADNVGEPSAGFWLKQLKVMKKKPEVVKEAISNITCRVDYRSIFAAQSKMGTQVQAIRKNRQGANFIDSDGIAALGSSRSNVGEETEIPNADVLMTRAYAKLYDNAIARVLEIKKSMDGENAKGYRPSDLENAKRHAREVREKANSCGKSAGVSISKSGYED